MLPFQRKLTMKKMQAKYEYLLKPLVIAAMGGLLNYFYQVRAKKQQFRWRDLFLSLALSAFVGYVVGDFIPVETTFRDGVIGLSGVLGFQLWGFFTNNAIPMMKAYWDSRLSKR